MMKPDLMIRKRIDYFPGCLLSRLILCLLMSEFFWFRRPSFHGSPASSVGLGVKTGLFKKRNCFFYNADLLREDLSYVRRNVGLLYGTVFKLHVYLQVNIFVQSTGKF